MLVAGGEWLVGAAVILSWNVEEVVSAAVVVAAEVSVAADLPTVSMELTVVSVVMVFGAEASAVVSILSVGASVVVFEAVVICGGFLDVSGKDVVGCCVVVAATTSVVSGLEVVKDADIVDGIPLVVVEAGALLAVVNEVSLVEAAEVLSGAVVNIVLLSADLVPSVGGFVVVDKLLDPASLLETCDNVEVVGPVALSPEVVSSDLVDVCCGPVINVVVDNAEVDLMDTACVVLVVRDDSAARVSCEVMVVGATIMVPNEVEDVVRSTVVVAAEVFISVCLLVVSIELVVVRGLVVEGAESLAVATTAVVGASVVVFKAEVLAVCGWLVVWGGKDVEDRCFVAVATAVVLSGAEDVEAADVSRGTSLVVVEARTLLAGANDVALVKAGEVVCGAIVVINVVLLSTESVTTVCGFVVVDTLVDPALLLVTSNNVEVVLPSVSSAEAVYRDVVDVCCGFVTVMVVDAAEAVVIDMAPVVLDGNVVWGESVALVS